METKYADGTPRVPRPVHRHAGGGDSRTHTMFTEECDLPKKIKRLARMGQLEAALKQPPLMFGDFTGVESYMDALLRVKAANEAFMSLDAKIRRRFDNNPQALLDAIADPSRVEELRELGVFEKVTPASSLNAGPEGLERSLEPAGDGNATEPPPAATETPVSSDAVA